MHFCIKLNNIRDCNFHSLVIFRIFALSAVTISLFAHGDKYFGEIANFTMVFDYVKV